MSILLPQRSRPFFKGQAVEANFSSQKRARGNPRLAHYPNVVQVFDINKAGETVNRQFRRFKA
jgi:hypothetical protein